MSELERARRSEARIYPLMRAADELCAAAKKRDEQPSGAIAEDEASRDRHFKRSRSRLARAIEGYEAERRDF